MVSCPRYFPLSLSESFAFSVYFRHIDEDNHVLIKLKEKKSGSVRVLRVVVQCFLSQQP